jgi:hypothetical protein
MFKNMVSKMTISENIALERYKETYRDMIIRRERKALDIHAMGYAIGNSILIAINLLFVPQFLWIVFPLMGWSTGLTVHYYLGVHTAPQRITRDELWAENMAGEEKVGRRLPDTYILFLVNFG